MLSKGEPSIVFSISKKATEDKGLACPSRWLYIPNSVSYTCCRTDLSSKLDKPALMNLIHLFR